MSWRVGEPIGERVILEVTQGVSCCSSWDLERLAEQTLDRADDHTPEALAKVCERRVVMEPGLPAAVPAQVIRGVVYYRSDRDRGLVVLMVCHELAHHLLPTNVDHADVWSLALALAMPRRLIVARGGEPFGHLPPWAVALRLAMPTVGGAGGR